MASSKIDSIEDYISAAPAAGQAQLRRLYTILKEVAPEAVEAIKWNTPFFIEPRFLFAFAAFKAHLSFTPNEEGLEPFAKELEDYDTNQGSIKIKYKDPLPEALIIKMAKYKVALLKERKDDSFW